MVTSAAKENDQFSQKFEAQDVDSLVQTPRTNVTAAGDRLRIHHRRFENLSNETNNESLRIFGIHEAERSGVFGANTREE